MYHTIRLFIQPCPLDHLIIRIFHGAVKERCHNPFIYYPHILVPIPDISFNQLFRRVVFSPLGRIVMLCHKDPRMVI